VSAIRAYARGFLDFCHTRDSSKKKSEAKSKESIKDASGDAGSKEKDKKETEPGMWVLAVIVRKCSNQLMLSVF
jgi:hypothetical protein